MEDRAIALGGLVATPISVGIVVGAVLHHIGMSDVACVTAGAAIAVPGAPSLPTSCSCATGASRTVRSRALARQKIAR